MEEHVIQTGHIIIAHAPLDLIQVSTVLTPARAALVRTEEHVQSLVHPIIVHVRLHLQEIAVKQVP